MFSFFFGAYTFLTIENFSQYFFSNMQKEKKKFIQS